MESLGQGSPSESVLLLSPPRGFALLGGGIGERVGEAAAAAGEDEEEEREEDGVDEEERGPQSLEERDDAVAGPRGQLLHLRRRHGR